MNMLPDVAWKEGYRSLPFMQNDHVSRTQDNRVHCTQLVSCVFLLSRRILQLDAHSAENLLSFLQIQTRA